MESNVWFGTQPPMWHAILCTRQVWVVKSIEGYNHAIIFVDAATGYRWLYGMKTKDDAINALRTWYADIADLRTKHKLVVLMRDNASEIKSEEMM